jgi:hypothetical protein
VSGLLGDAFGLLRNTITRRDSNRNGRSYALTVVTPIRPGQSAALAREIGLLGLGTASPLAQLPHVHFGRWLVIDKLKTDWKGAPRRPSQLKSEYLLFSASLTAPGPKDGYPETFLRELATAIPEVAGALWRHCEGYPGLADPPDAFVRYLAKSRVKTHYFYVGYADVTVNDVRGALADRDALIEFASHPSRQHMDPAQLQREYVTTFAS